jgi:hypothetical protein
MRALFGLLLGVCLASAASCERTASFDGPKTDKFVGKLVHDGKPVSFAPTEKVQLKVIHEKGQSFDVPIAADGTFTVGWMPIGKYSAILLRDKQEAKGMPSMYNVPDGLTISDGQSEYTIELGKAWKL